MAEFTSEVKYNCSQEHLDIFMLSKWKYAFIGSLQLVIHVVQNLHAGEQGMH